ncbi:MAG: HesA/MoeB/ThiF family protein [Candidatus Hodarchaeales archaeon]
MDRSVLSPEEKIRFSRQIVLPDIGESGQLKLKNSRVLVLGVGGLGTFSSLLLAEMGVGYLRIVDRDLVEQTNLHRTPLYSKDDLDKAKVEVAAERLQRLNPNLIVDTHACHIDENNIFDLVSDIDIVIDGLDNFQTRRVVNRACLDKGIPFVFCGVSGKSGNLSVFNLTEKSPCVSCLYHEINDNDLESCDITGIHPSLLSIATGIQVYEAVNILIHKTSNLDGKLLFIDLNRLSFDLINLQKNLQCPVCSSISKKVGTVVSEGYQSIDICGGNSYMLVPNKKTSFNIQEISTQLEEKYEVLKLGRLSLSLVLEPGTILTIFQGGNVLVRNVASSQKALSLWEKILYQDILGI